MRFLRALPLADRSLPFVSMDWFFPAFPNLTRDKFHWFARYIQGSFAAGAAFVLLVYHTPYGCADYDHEYKSCSTSATGISCGRVENWQTTYGSSTLACTGRR